MVSPPDPELAADQVHVVALVLEIDETAQDAALIVLLAPVEDQELGLVLLG